MAEVCIFNPWHDMALAYGETASVEYEGKGEEYLTNYEELSDAISAQKTNDSNMWLTVMDYCDYNFRELEDNNLTVESVGTFSFDRYTFDVYEVVPIQ